MSEAEQSLEDILSSIRKKISSDPDMSASAAHVEGALASETSASPVGDVAQGSSVLGAQPGIAEATIGGSAASQALKDEFAARLPGMFGRPKTDEADAVSATGAAASDDDLSDMFEDPLGEPVESGGDTDPVVLGDVKSGSMSSETAAATEPTEPLNGKLGSFAPSGLDSTDVAPPSDGDGLAARLKVTAPSPLAPLASGVGEDLKSESSSADEGAVAADTGAEEAPVHFGRDPPRSMDALSSGFSLSTDDAAEGEETSANQSDVDGGDADSDASSRLSVSVSTSKATALPEFANEPSGVAPAIVASVIPVVQEPSATPSAPKQFPYSSPATEAAAAASPMPPGVRSLEDTVSEMVRPMLRDWIEANMPRIVENALRIEVLESSGGGDTED